MEVETSQVTRLKITGGDRLDPVTVFLEDLGPKQGKVTIECYGESWSASWGGMGDRTVADFFCSCDEHYLANKLSSIRGSVDDFDGLADHARKHIIDGRKSHDFEKAEARRLYDRCEDLSGVENFDQAAPAMADIYGPEWWYAVPTKPNPDYQYLCRIILCVQEALTKENTAVDSSSGVIG